MKRDDLLAMMASDVEEPTGEADASLVELGEKLVSMRDHLAELKDEVKNLQEDYDDLRSVQLPEAMARAGMVSSSGTGSFSLTDGSSIYLGSQVHTYCRKDDHGKLHKWLRSKGHGDLIKETVHPQTLKAFAREQLEQGAPLPSVLQTYHETGARVRRKG